ncbi:hypothetical protein HU200_051049 [Digitaria exilis]|uniref:Uncharacterized protein n=1 Tax=Digitaria exilis TaxID=1010633 RepID=A0A835ATG1_9POAL|nr:hypothetical protein HU200_051049 [Digitaria exilis]CAB3479887.1 unnamed protein product [Digitaria exilis]
MAATGGAADASLKQEEALAAAFEEKHAELVAEARGVAREFGVDVRAVAFRPVGGGGGGAVVHEFQGIPPAARVVRTIRRAVAKDVSAMGMEEVAQHERQLLALRNIVVRELQARKKATAAKKAMDVAIDGAATKRAPEQQEEVAGGGGESKVRKIIID